MGIAKAVSLDTSTMQELRSMVWPCGNYFEGEQVVRCRCGEIHDPTTAAEVNPLEETRRLLEEYVRHCQLPWPGPDEVICRRTLEAAGGSLVFLAARLRHLLFKRKAAPSESYAWFPKVCAVETRRLA